MSGALAALAAAAGAPLAASLLGVVQTAAWRGVAFDMLDSRHSAGRRWVQFLFPGRADTLQEDLGAIDGPIEVNALIIGDDWLRRQRRLEAACKQAGPGTLLHPWLGELRCTLVAPAEFQFDHQKQRVCTVTLRFQVWQEQPGAAPSSLGGLLDALDGAIDAAQLSLAGVLAPLGDALGLLGLAQSVLARAAGVWDGLLGISPSGTGTDSTGALAAAAAAPLDALSGGVALLGGPMLGQGGLAPQLAGLLAAVPAALARAADSAADPAIGPGPLAPAPAPAADPRAAASLLLDALAQLQPQAGDLPVARAMLQAARVQAAAEAARAASGTSWDSRDEAVGWRGRVDAALAGVQAELAGAAAGPAWRALRDVRTAWARDLNEAIGRLPPVQHAITYAPLSAWQIALAAAGDTPAAIRPAMLDFVRRNRIRHPGLVPPGRHEVVGFGLRPVTGAAPAAVAAAPETVAPNPLRLALSIGGAVIAVGGAPILASSADPFAILGAALSIGGQAITLGGEPILAG